MTEARLEALAQTLPSHHGTDEAVECHRNYASRERNGEADVFVTRKGAISAREDELGIVPGSMGTLLHRARTAQSRELPFLCTPRQSHHLSKSDIGVWRLETVIGSLLRLIW